TSWKCNILIGVIHLYVPSCRRLRYSRQEQELLPNARKGMLAMVDDRVRRLAELLVERCMEVKTGDKVLLNGGVVGRPLLVEVTRQVARRGAEPILMPSFSETQRVILTETPEDRLDMVPEIQDYIIRHVDAMLALQ